MITSIPLSALDPSPQNVRRSGGKSIAELAANIHAVDLLHNLVVRSGVAGRFEVVDGHRRLEALKRLVADQRLPSDFKVPCRLMASNTDEDATEASLSANTMTEVTHPADQFEAFRKLVAGGKPIADVAAHFGVTELVVERRLRLANVAPELLEAFRNDRLSLELMMAFAITDDHAAQLRVWKECGEGKWQVSVARVRQSLAQSDIPTTDRRVRLVGLDRYEAAGGAVRRDLFDDTGGGFVLDGALLDRLVGQVLEEKAAEVSAEGWSFVKLMGDGEASSFEWSCDRSQPKKIERTLTADEAQQLEGLRARAEELAGQLNEAPDWDEASGEDDDRLEQIEAELEDTRRQIRALSEPTCTFTDRQKAKAGAVVSLGHDGELRVVRGLIPRVGEKAAKAVAADKGEKAAPKPATLAESMVRRLTAHRTIALQAGLMANANVALAALAHALLDPLLAKADGTGHTALHVRASLRLDQLENYGFEDVTQSAHYARTQAAIAELRDTLQVPTRRAELLPWLLQQNRDTVVALLAAVAVMTVDAVQGDDRAHPAEGLLAALDLDPADYWQPTAASFFSLVPRALAEQALKEALGTDQAETILASASGMKKLEFAGYCESLIARTGWLPKPLRRSGYKLRASKDKPIADAQAPRAKTAPAAKKKPAKKAGMVKRAPAKSAKKAAKNPAAKKTKKTARK